MPTVSRSFTVRPAPDVVIPYLADFGHAEEWDPGTEKCTRIGAGPIQVGTSWLNTSKIAGISTELNYTLEQLTDRRIVLVGRNETAESTETIEVSPDGSGSRITYINNVDFHGVAKLAAPAAKLVFEKLGHDTEQQLTQTLNGLAG